MLNYLFVFLIIVSVVFYLFFKTKQFRTRQMLPIHKKMYASMAGASLGLFILSFGFNQIVLFDKITIYIISAIFILLGLYVLIFNFRAYKHYSKFVKEEAEINKV